MYYFISVIMLTMLPTGEPVIERSITGPFVNREDCMLYSNMINNIAKQAITSNIIESECRKKEKGKAV
jgi:hypothetical protein